MSRRPGAAGALTDPSRRIRRIEDWAGRHDQWAAQTAVGVRAQAAEVEERVMGAVRYRR